MALMNDCNLHEQGDDKMWMFLTGYYIAVVGTPHLQWQFYQLLVMDFLMPSEYLGFCIQPVQQKRLHAVI